MSLFFASLKCALHVVTAGLVLLRTSANFSRVTPLQQDFSYVGSMRTISAPPIVAYRRLGAIYADSRSFIILGSGFSAPTDAQLTIELMGASALVQGTDFSITHDDEFITVTLQEEHHWVDYSHEEDHINAIPLMLSMAWWSSNPQINLLFGGQPVQVAKVLRTPSVERNERLLAASQPDLFIKGSGFVGNIVVIINFEPPLEVGIDYIDLTVRPMNGTLHLQLASHRCWRDDPGPLRVVSVDTGAGSVSALSSSRASNDFEEGVIVANILPDSPTSRPSGAPSFSSTSFGSTSNATDDDTINAGSSAGHGEDSNFDDELTSVGVYMITAVAASVFILMLLLFYCFCCWKRSGILLDNIESSNAESFVRNGSTFCVSNEEDVELTQMQTARVNDVIPRSEAGRGEGISSMFDLGTEMARLNEIRERIKQRITLSTESMHGLLQQQHDESNESDDNIENT